MKHLSLFNGIGGFQLAAFYLGWDNVASVEINQFCNQVTKYHFPNCKQYEDIKEFDGIPYKGVIDIISGGFPCQPYSQAGKRLGKADDRHLWPEMLRIIQEVQPCYVVGENVRGITNWNGGMVFNEVQADLEAEGYEVLPFLLPACAVNAPHRRDRIWFVAYNTCSKSFKKEQKKYSKKNRHETYGGNKIITNSDSGQQSCKEYRQKKSGQFAETSISGNWQDFPTQSPVCNGNDGFSLRLDGITFPKWRNETIKAAGNAIVPQIAFEIFKAINQFIGNNF